MNDLEIKKASVEELKNKIYKLEEEIEKRTQLISNMLINSFVKKCEWCGCPDGIHKSNCRFIKNI